VAAVSQVSKKRVMTLLSEETISRVKAEQKRINQETGCKPSLSGVVAAAIERGLPPR